MWKELGTTGKGGLDLDEPTPIEGGIYLGCSQADIPPPLDLINEKREFMRPHLASTENATASKVKELAEQPNAGGNPTPASALVSNAEGPVEIKAWQYFMHGHVERCITKYCELANAPSDSLKPVTTPNLDDHQLQPEDFENKGVLATIASRVVLTALFFARIVRADCL